MWKSIVLCVSLFGGAALGLALGARFVEPAALPAAAAIGLCVIGVVLILAAPTAEQSEAMEQGQLHRDAARRGRRWMSSRSSCRRLRPSRIGLRHCRSKRSIRKSPVCAPFPFPFPFPLPGFRYPFPDDVPRARGAHASGAGWKPGRGRGTRTGNRVQTRLKTVRLEESAAGQRRLVVLDRLELFGPRLRRRSHHRRASASATFAAATFARRRADGRFRTRGSCTGWPCS